MTPNIDKEIEELPWDVYESLTITKQFLEDKISQAKQEERERVLGEVEKLQEYEDKKLGSIDLTLNEMFDRGYNSAVKQLKSLISKLRKE